MNVLSTEVSSREQILVPTSDDEIYLLSTDLFPVVDIHMRIDLRFKLLL